MAFAGNDLVNFIGVPITALQSFELWSAAGVPSDSMLMSGLAAEMRSPTLPLLIAGAVMFLTLWFSAKARKVTATTVDLSRQSAGEEKFRAHTVARAVVRHSRSAGETFTRLLSRRTRVIISMRFRNPEGLEDAPAFDLLRGAVNLMVASILIAWGTLLKLPLSTTYVTFMVAMGASLADGAWSAGSAEQRVAGVLNVFGGWLLTGLGAFIMAALMALALFHGGDATAVGLTASGSFRTCAQPPSQAQEAQRTRVQRSRLRSPTRLDHLGEHRRSCIPMHAFHCPDLSLDELPFPEEEAHHAALVLRAKAGDRCRLIDGKGTTAFAELTEVGQARMQRSYR